MFTKIKISFIAVLLFSIAILFSSCGNKVDNTLDKYDALLSKYESKAKDKPLTQEQFDEFEKEYFAIGNDYKIATNNESQDEWSQSQRERFEKIDARHDQLVGQSE